MNKMIQSSLEAFTSQVANTLASNLNQNITVSVPRISHGGENPNGSSRQIPCNQGASGENKGKRSLSCNQEDSPLLPQKKKIKIRVVPPPPPPQFQTLVMMKQPMIILRTFKRG